MMSRREVMSAGVLGSLAVGTPAAAAETPQDSAVLARLEQMNDKFENLTSIAAAIRSALSSSMSTGYVGLVKDAIEKHLRTSGKFPDYVEIGSSVFYDVYDWHVRMQQQIQITQLSDQRLMIKFMFTQLILRWEQAQGYIGAPYDGGIK